jgi:hypothetical protein
LRTAVRTQFILLFRTRRYRFLGQRFFLAASSNRIERKSGRSESSSALNEVNDQDDDGNYEQEMDQAPANVADEAKKPENDQDDNYGPEQGYTFRLS